MNKTIQYLLSLTLFLLLAGSAQASESRFSSAKHAVGFSVGSSMGPGLTYRIYSPSSFVQGVFFSRANSRDDITDFMLGASYGRIISEISIAQALPPTALVFVASFDGRYSKDQFDYSVNGDESGDEKAMHAGGGIALEIGNVFSPGLLFSLGTTYVLGIEQQSDNREWNLGPQINMGLLYNW